MNSIPALLSPLVTTFLHTTDDSGGPIVFSKVNLDDLTTNILNENPRRPSRG